MSAFLTDGTVNLRPVTRADLPQLAAWRNDPELRARTREFRPLTYDHQNRWFERINAPDSRDFMFVVERDVAATTACRPSRPMHKYSIETKEGRCDCGMKPRDWKPPSDGPDEDLQPIGVVGLCHWDYVNGSAEVSFYIGAEAARGKGYATKAVTVLQRWGFSELRLHRIWAEVYAFNEPSIKLLERLGHVKEGTLRSHVWRGGRYVDSHVYGLLASDWMLP